jgi:VanZ family protein
VLYLCFGRFDNAPSVEWSLFGIPTDKLVHFCMFFPFPILAFLAFDRYTETARQTLTFVGITLAVGLLLAVGTEWGQAHFTDYRSADPWDFVADTSALVVSSILVSIWDIRKQKK